MGSTRTLAELAGVVDGHVIGDPQVDIHDVTHDSREAREGALFVAIVGRNRDGHDFVVEACKAGASAVCVQRRVDTPASQLIVANTRASLGQLADETHDHPSRSLGVVGVTGTNGKTTVTHYVESLLAQSGVKTGLIGTITTRIGDRSIPSMRTTPEASDLQRLLARMRDEGVSKVAMEVSSHALELYRVDGTKFEVAAFTNLSQDHLDFHGSMERYRLAKERLFRDFDIGTAIINIDDAVGSEMAGWYRGNMVTVGSGGDFAADRLAVSHRGVSFSLRSPSGEFLVEAPVLGRFNVSNLVVAIASCHAAGLDIEEVVSHVPSLRPVPGRYEIVSGPSEPLVVVDYAHTPQGIEEAVATAREMTNGRVLVVFGAGGDRDRAKRPLMGRAASRADVVLVTSDNPRSEDPEAIVDQVGSGITTAFTMEPDRRKAIAVALGMAQPNDTVLILGKGHETGQERAGAVTPFDDREVARATLKSLRKSTNSLPDSGSMET